jgi:signal transduction histidine kinase
MKKKKVTPVLWGILTGIALLLAAVLAVGFAAGEKAGYGKDVWEEVFQGKTYLESEEYQQEAAGIVYDAIGVMARSSRLEEDGAYDPNRIIRVRDYLDARTIYDSIPESEKENGICYRLGDLYQWSLKGTTKDDDVLKEAYSPLFYNSIQEYAVQCDESYNTVVKQIENAMELLKSDVAAYQKEKKTWAFGATNARYVLKDLANGNIFTNVDALQDRDISQEQLEAYFKAFGSYYIYDSRTAGVAQENVGDYYSYNTQELLTEAQVHLAGEYQVYVGIDTTFPVNDALAAGAQSYEEAHAALRPYVKPLLVSALILALIVLVLLIRLAFLARKFLMVVLGNVNTALRICIYFIGYEFVQTFLRYLFGTGAVLEIVLLIFKLIVLGLLIFEGIQRQRLLEGVQAMAEGNGEGTIPVEHLYQGNRELAEAVNDLGEGLRNALQEQMKSERMKADLITNVSHDLKTPLTSIINYVDLMKREQIDNPRAQEYLQVLDQKSQRLKQLTDDLVEASRASSGNVTLQLEKIDLKEILLQTSGEFEERFAARGLTLVADYPKDPLYVEADGRRLWRIIENLYRNVEKYAMPNTRVYLNIRQEEEMASISMKNISEQPLNISAEELMERFVRGDESRTTEGSGLGLSIARDLTELQNGSFDIYLDGDLFKVTVAFPLVEDEKDTI